MKKTALVIMAAGIGSRFGKGIKQLEPVGPNGEIIMDYSIHDALEAGFNKVVFIIRKDLEKDFKEVIGNRISKITEVEYAFQELDDLPAGFAKPEGRTKPWGTGQAVLACKGLVKEPFAVINADDYYGKDPFVKLHDYLVQEHDVDEVMPISMAGFVLGNTLSDNGGVTRGVCVVDENGNLTGVNETKNIVKTAEGAGVEKEDGTVDPIDKNSLVSMNMWGLQPEFIDLLEKGFVEFLSAQKEGDVKGEYLLPIYIDELLHAGKAEVKVLLTTEKWYGVTYREDKPMVMAAVKKLEENDFYPKQLCGKLEAAANFCFEGVYKEEIPWGNGHINDTYRVTFENEQGVKKHYILQQMNKSIFKNPVELMENIVGVTEFLKRKISANGGNPERETLNVIPAKDGKPYYVDSEGEYWRAYVFIENTVSYDLIDNPEILYEGGLYVSGLSGENTS